MYLPARRRLRLPHWLVSEGGCVICQAADTAHSRARLAGERQTTLGEQVMVADHTGWSPSHEYLHENGR